MLLKALLITVLGLPVCGALAFGSVAYVFEAWLSGEPLPASDHAGAIVFGFFSFLVIAIALAMNRRARRQQSDTDTYPRIALPHRRRGSRRRISGRVVQALARTGDIVGR